MLPSSLLWNVQMPVISGMSPRNHVGEHLLVTSLRALRESSVNHLTLAHHELTLAFSRICTCLTYYITYIRFLPTRRVDGVNFSATREIERFINVLDWDTIPQSTK